MLLSVVLTLQPERRLAEGRHMGRGAHAALLNLISQRDAGLASALHDDAQIKPFTASSLIGDDGGRSELWKIRFTSLNEKASSVLANICEQPPAQIVLDGIRCSVVAATCQSAADDLAGEASYQILARAPLFARRSGSKKLALEFLSPTTFRSGGRNVPVPLPELVFGSLLERWNAFAPIVLDAELRRFASERLAISRYQLRTELVNVGGGKQVGFRGICEYVALDEDEFWLRQIVMLAEFAFYSGVGYKTTMGLGQARRISDGRAVSRRARSNAAERGRVARGDEGWRGDREGASGES